MALGMSMTVKTAAAAAIFNGDVRVIMLRGPLAFYFGNSPEHDRNVNETP